MRTWRRAAPRTVRTPLLAPLVIAIVVVTLTACGRKTFPEVFTEENAWQGEVPSDARIVAPDDFRRMVGTGELSLITTLEIEEQAAAREADFDEHKRQLESEAVPPSLEALVGQLAEVEDYVGDTALELATGQSVMLEGIGTQVENAVTLVQLAASAENALTDYRQTYMLLPETVKSQVATPESLVNASAEEIREALADIDAALAGSDMLNLAHLELTPNQPGPDVEAAQIRPGVGSDQDTPCTAPSNLAALYWFPLKNFISPVKNQGNRGTCWAFTAIGAVESRERVQNANPVNVSEQFFVNKVKEDWDESEYTDGYNAVRALNLAVDEGQSLPNESGWTYNTSPNRSTSDGSAANYANSCNPYGTGPNAGSCSDSSHQSPRVCSTFIFTVCGYSTVTFSGAGTGASRAYQVWANGQSFDLNRYRLMLSQGYVLMASFPVYKGFAVDVTSDGLVTNYAKTRLDAMGNEVDGSYGNHAVQIVGFLSNEEMSKPGRTPVNVGGGGYFIVKNSWGCGSGDGGYYYVPADYVSSLFHSLSALSFDGRRSAAWTAEQTTPGGSEAPTIQIKANPATVDLRVETDLANFFRVTHGVAKGVTLKVTNQTLGTIYNGPWSTDPDALFGSSLKYVFQQPGDYYLALEARYGTAVAGATLLARVVNSPPAVTIQTSGTAYQDEPYAMSAVVSDKNDADVGSLCADTTWSVSAPDTLSTSSGCQVEVTFGTSGARTVSVTVKDADNLTTTRSATLAVQPPRENPYPLITASGVYAIVGRFFDNQFIGCDDVAVSPGTTIDLRDKGCSLTIGTAPNRYFAGVTVENPDGEALTYDWRLVLTFAQTGTERVLISSTGASDPQWTLYTTGNAALSTDPCRVEVKVNAPESARSKSKTVWSGSCTYYATQIN